METNDGNREMAAARELADERPTSRGELGAARAAEEQRALAEVQAAVMMARRFPRDPNIAFTRIATACKRASLADQALYAYSRGGTMVEGPSIRLAETLAQNWGNLQFGIRELARAEGESEIEAFAWDLETNVRQSRIFRVIHRRQTKKGAYDLTDERDIYELNANQGARRVRACILGIIPGDVVEAAVEQCKKTMAGGGGEPLADRVRKMVAMFQELGVPQAAIEKRVGHNLDAVSEAELVKLRAVYKSIRDGFAGREEFFDLGAGREMPRGKSEKAADGADVGAAAGSQDEDPNNPINEARHKVLVDAIAKRKVPDEQLAAMLEKYGFADTAQVTVGKFSEVLAEVADWKPGKSAK